MEEWDSCELSHSQVLSEKTFFFFKKNLSPTSFSPQVDFIRGAAEGFDGRGKPIIALQSSNAKTGESKIVPFLKQGEIYFLPFLK